MNNTKKKLAFSIICLMLCLSMLIGATFAWFTDSASTNVSSVKSGNLKVDLVDADGNTLVGKTVSFVKSASAPATEAILWEPGATYNAAPVYVKNLGDLALKFKVSVTGLNGNAKLLEVIDFTTNLPADDTILAPGGTSDAITISGTMKTTANNDYQGLTADGIAITVIATQATAEWDSTTNQYDKDATYPVSSQADLDNALANAPAGSVLHVEQGTMALNNNISAGTTVKGTAGQEPTLTVEQEKGVDMAEGSTIENAIIQDNNPSNGRYYEGVINLTGDNATLKDVTVNGTGATTWDAAVAVSLKAGETAYILNTKINGGFRGIFLGSQSGNVVIDGCVINPVAYTISVDGGGDMTLTVKNTTLNGWLSHSALKEVTYTDCKFGSNGSYAFFRPYSAVTLTRCDFEAGYEIDSSEGDITLVDCTIDGVKLTAANAGVLFDGGTVPANVTIK